MATKSEDSIVPVSNLSIHEQGTLPVNVDFITALRWQAELDPDLSLYSLVGHVTEPITSVSPTKKDLTFEFGEISQAPNNRFMTKIEVGSPDPRNRAEATFDDIPQIELFESIVATANIDDLAVNTRGMLQEIPSGVAKHPLLDGSDLLYHAQRSHGNRSKSLQQQTGLEFTNTYQLIKDEMMSRGDLDERSASNFSKRAKGTFATELLLPDNGADYRALGSDSTLHDLLHQLLDEKYWQDVASPHVQKVSASDRQMPLRLYELDRYGGLVGIGV